MKAPGRPSTQRGSLWPLSADTCPATSCEYALPWILNFSTSDAICWVESINNSLERRSTVERHTAESERQMLNDRIQSGCNLLTVIHERIFELWARKADALEVVQEQGGAAGVHHVAQAQDGHSVQEGKNIGARPLHRQDHDATAVPRMVCQHWQNQIGVKWRETGGRFIEQQKNCKRWPKSFVHNPIWIGFWCDQALTRVFDDLHADHKAAVLTVVQSLDPSVRDVSQRQISQNLLHARSPNVIRDLSLVERAF